MPEKIYFRSDLIELISHYKSLRKSFAEKARVIQKENCANGIYIRGLIEVSSFCRCNCLYCGIRKDNTDTERYRLSDEEILSRCEYGYTKGFRTFVLQGGEDLVFSDIRVAEIITHIKSRFPDCAVTLSLGERDEKTYRLWKDSGADRYLLRHEARDPKLFSLLHPSEQKLETRLHALETLKSLGYQTGSGFMVGAPYQTIEKLADDILYLQNLKPEMIGIGPFIPHNKTPFASYQNDFEKRTDENSPNKNSSEEITSCTLTSSLDRAELTCFLISLLRIIFPHALIPATTALNTLSQTGRKDGILSGANVIMPNLSPLETRAKYDLYEGKSNHTLETAEELERLENEMNKIGYKILFNERGDFKNKY
ncbi:MAG: [FeFe] hydrogenase H-cluster radical SAM maturase HydE [Treponema sp.]|nr:[FeFe] hydrogenase H-cluster radical SAM maturase HydE [Candidatus Treponema scatequi]